MQQDYVAFFKELLITYYDFALDHGVYTACLAITVWLVTAILYSFRIGSLQKQINTHLKAAQEGQNQIQLLRQDISDIEQQAEREKQHTEALQTRLDEMAAHVAESILAMASTPELGQAGLTVREDLPVEQLWQRYQGGVSQICERLQTQLQTQNQLEQANQESSHKLADKELQLQAALLKADNLKQQIAALETALQEKEQLLTEQEQIIEQRVAAATVKFQADLAKLASLEQQFAEVQQKLKRQSEQSFFAKPAEIKPEPAVEAIAPEPQAQPARNESIKPESGFSRSETLKPLLAEREAALESRTAVENKAASAETTPAGSSGFGNRFKSMLNNAKQKIDKLDEKLGQRTPLPQDIEEPEVVAPPQAAAADAESGPETSSITDVKDLGGKFKKLFGAGKAKTEESLTVAAETLETAVNKVEGDKPATAALGDKLKGFFRGGKTAVAEPPVEVITPPEPEKSGVAEQVKNLFGKFKR